MLVLLFLPFFRFRLEGILVHYLGWVSNLVSVEDLVMGEGLNKNDRVEDKYLVKINIPAGVEL